MGSIIKYKFVFIFLCAFVNLKAQDSTSITKKNIFNNLQPVIGLDANRSFFLGQIVRVNGFRLGIKIVNRYRFGIALYSSEYIRIPDLINSNGTFLRKTKCGFGHLFWEYVWLNQYKWSGDAGFGLGSAKGELYMKRTDNLFDSVYISPPTGLLKFYGSIEYKIFPFIGVSVGLGYIQLTADKNHEAQKQVSKAFSSPFYDINLKIHISEVYKFLFKKQVYQAEREAYLLGKQNKK